MTDTPRDPVLDDAISELERLPPADDRLVESIVAAAASMRAGAAPDGRAEPDGRVEPDGRAKSDGRTERGPRHRRAVSLGALAAVAAAAAIVGFVARGFLSLGESAPELRAPLPPVALGNGGASVRAAEAVELESMPIPHQFVFVDASARRVSVVGDFNDWNPDATPMKPELPGRNGTWIAVAMIPPGRHTYAFLVDSVLTLDPHAPKATDPSLGVEGSVVVVGRP